MADIIHRVGIKGAIEEIYCALTTDEGLSRWWTSTTDGAGDVGSIINFRFNDTVVQFQVIELIKNQLVRWQHYGNMPDVWSGTQVSFQLKPKDKQVFVCFSHSNWKEACDFMGHCSTKWAVFLMSLKNSVETGQGQAFPNDVHIDHDE